MSLTDLKRKKPKQIIKPVSVDDFIEDANNYALGKASLLAAAQTQAIVKGLNKKSTKIYRHATFTLTEKSIAQLDSLSKSTSIAKSRLLRILIHEFSQLTPAQQDQIANKRHDET
ncbi:replication protein RepA [Shewanella baltica]|uniref:replication protein RepA n=1 Tax=Shewanella baltica TaxID=62322 RepID=UPI00217D7B58|nr:replication protein RepA [Shewanella baltica]MCS6178315.1 replication protein RepA [Shewanella baltica]MCS6254461.1 replication protein RepA [Shewanella baltica]